MACPINEDELNKLKTFVGICSSNPGILNLPQLSFLKTFVEKLGGTVPAGTGFDFKGAEQSNQNAQAEPETEASAPVEDSDPESDVDLDTEGCVEPDTDAPQAMGDTAKVPTDEEIDQAGVIRSNAAAAFSEQNFEQAFALYTEAIQLNPTNSLYYAKRGQALLKLSKPNACIRDCDRALELNCDSAAAYKFRGRANRLLGNWETAATDLRQACKIDFDEEADEWLREVTPNAKKLVQHRIKQERKKATKDLQERQERIRKAQEANRKAAEERSQSNTNDFGSGTGGPGAGGPGGAFSQSDLLGAFKDPEVAAAFQDIMANPANIGKYASNPKVMNLINKVGGAMGGGGGNMFGGGFPNFGGAPPNANPSAPKPPPTDFQDDGLD